jgi:hypothetical protein
MINAHGVLIIIGCCLTLGCEGPTAPAATTLQLETPAATAPIEQTYAEPPTSESQAAFPALASDTASAPPVASPAVAAAEPALPPSAQPVADKKKQPAGGLKDITFDDVKLDLKKDEKFNPAKLTPAVKALDGQPVRIRGYILPSFQQTGLAQFVLVRDNQECCFGPGAALHDCILVEMLPGKSTDFTVRPVAVEGKFTLIEFKDPDGVVRAIYHLDGQVVK